MEMGSQSHLAAVEEEFINMEITTPYYSNSSPQIQSKDFEFQHLSSASSSASDLFYRGKLLPLHLRRPPPFLSAPCTTSNTPSDSCNISPSQSCRPSCDLIINPTHFTDLSITTFFFNNNNNSQHPPKNNNNNNNSWSKMKKLNKRSYLAHKLKSSRAFLKSLFFTKETSKPHDPTSYSRFGKKFATLIKKNGIIDDHRRSFSGAIASDSSSSTTSFSSSSSSSFNEVQFLRSSSSAAEIEVSIDAAIAHCKKSYATN